jgi:hypothetical protein
VRRDGAVRSVVRKISELSVPGKSIHIHIRESDPPLKRLLG